MNFKNLQTIYFLGVGGIGMSALARYFVAIGCNVYGYDKTKTNLTTQLENEGVNIHYDEDISLIPNEIKTKQANTLVVYTPAIPTNNKEWLFFKENNILIHKRSEVLGLISQNYYTIAVAGTHGKTTTSSMIAHVLQQCGVACNAFLGGISLNFNSNLVLNSNAKIMVVEADEFDRSFLTLSPDLAIITSLDADHLDIYEDKKTMHKAYQDFTHKIKNQGTLFTKDNNLPYLNLSHTLQTKTYSISESADYQAKNRRISNGNFVVDIKTPKNIIRNVEIGLPGIHNIENALAAFAVADLLQIDNEKIKMALASYRGVHRRFEYHIKKPNLVYLDDYAHHPTELSACILSIKEIYPNKKITGIFQPHLYTRTRDFTNEFAESLSLLDTLILLDIYPARELPIEGVTSQMLLEKVSIKDKKIVKREDVINELKKSEIEILVTLGAGNIDELVEPITEYLTNSK
ncbi:MAG: UDP-N-acetylmuramate--L-alanine ligase [Flavobacteriales bacterium CG_4_9_14_0_2_um_filter_32_27]|nr:MAG: UDP-N-acetylmuramate--L-alanine ligase [Flavobacteriales bacterium CG_4_9_14_0_2_um_filter_32_27]